MMINIWFFRKYEQKGVKMSRLRKLIPLLLVAALTLVAAVPVLAQTRALYQCTVYENNVLVGADETVAAFVGTETTARDTATTNAAGVAALEFAVAPDEIGDPVRFEVNGIACTETPNVNVSIEGLQVRLDYGAGATYTLTVTVSPSGKGTVSLSPSQPAGGYAAGTPVTLTASAISDWDFDYWGGAASGTSPTTTVTMNANKSVTAYFEEEAGPVTGTFASWLYETFVECLVD
jgi:inner membrane protein involved in colicin E2 resistance